MLHHHCSLVLPLLCLHIHKLGLHHLLLLGWQCGHHLLIMNQLLLLLLLEFKLLLAEVVLLLRCQVGVGLAGGTCLFLSFFGVLGLFCDGLRGRKAKAKDAVVFLGLVLGTAFLVVGVLVHLFKIWLISLKIYF